MRKSIIICLILCIIVPLSSEAKKQAFGNGVYWELSDGVLTISGTGSMPDFNYFKGNKIIKAPWYDEGIKIRKVIVEEGVTSIGCQSFYAVENYFKGWPIEDKEKYRNIVSIELPKSIKVIGNYAFYGLKGLNKVFLYEGLQTIGEHAFSGSSLQEIVFPSTIQNIGRYAFKSCSKIQKVELPQSLTVIEAYCFQYCESLSFVKWPTSLKVIEELAFDGCNLSNLNLPGGVKVGGYAFQDNGIKTLNIPLDCILDANRGPFHPSQTNTYCDVQIICLPTYINVQNANRYGLSITSVQNYANSIKDNTGKVIVALKEGQEISQLTTKGSNIYYYIIDGSFIGIVDRSGMWIISLDQRCSKAEMAGDNYVKFEHNCNYGVIRLDGKEIIPTNRGYSSIEYNSSKGTFAVAKPGYTGVCDAQGNEISLTKLPPTADDIKADGGYASAVELMNGSTKYYKVSKGGKYGLTNAEGKVIVPTEMEALESAGTGYLRYKLNGFWGLMDYAGKIIIDTDRGYTSIGDFKTFNKRFPYTMTGYKGECDINGRQISKIKVETPKQNSSLSKSSSKGLTTQQNNGVYPFEYSESNSFYECQMKENKFLSLISSESFRIKISQQKNGNKYLVELYLNSLVTGSTVVKWSNSSPKTTNNNDLCTIIMTLSSGETLRIERCMMIDKRRKDFQNSDRIGAIGIMFLPFYTYPSSNNQSSSEREQYVIDQLSKYDIKSISYIGSTFSFESAKTASTIDAMLKSIRNHR